MKKKKSWTKDKLSITVNSEILEYLSDNIENKSKYVEYLIYQDLKENGKFKKELYIL